MLDQIEIELVGRMEAGCLDFYLLLFRNMHVIRVDVHGCKYLCVWRICVRGVGDRLDFDADEVDFVFVVLLIFNQNGVVSISIV